MYYTHTLLDVYRGLQKDHTTWDISIKQITKYVEDHGDEISYEKASLVRHALRSMGESTTSYDHGFVDGLLYALNNLDIT